MRAVRLSVCSLFDGKIVIIICCLMNLESDIYVGGLNTCVYVER